MLFCKGVYVYMDAARHLVDQLFRPLYYSMKVVESWLSLAAMSDTCFFCCFMVGFDMLMVEWGLWGLFFLPVLWYVFPCCMDLFVIHSVLKPNWCRFELSCYLEDFALSTACRATLAQRLANSLEVFQRRKHGEHMRKSHGHWGWYCNMAAKICGLNFNMTQYGDILFYVPNVSFLKLMERERFPHLDSVDLSVPSNSDFWSKLVQHSHHLLHTLPCRQCTYDAWFGRPLRVAREVWLATLLWLTSLRVTSMRK